MAFRDRVDYEHVKLYNFHPFLSFNIGMFIILIFITLSFLINSVLKSENRAAIRTRSFKAILTEKTNVSC